jgi:hypothetical protein
MIFVSLPGQVSDRPQGSAGEQQNCPAHEDGTHRDSYIFKYPKH